MFDKKAPAGGKHIRKSGWQLMTPTSSV